MHPFKLLPKAYFRILHFLMQALKPVFPDRLYTYLQHKIQSSINVHRYAKEINLLLASGFFDEAYYKSQFPSNFFRNINPAEHYFTAGGLESKNPSPLFDSSFYLDMHVDVKRDRMNPLYHYLVWGRPEGRRIKAASEPSRFRPNDAPIQHYSGRNTILFISHEGNIAGAQILLLNLLRWIAKNTAFSLKIIALEGGPLLKEFEELAPVLNWQNYKSITDPFSLNRILSEFCPKADLVYGNTVLATRIYQYLSYLKAPFVTHIHELQKVISHFQEQGKVESLAKFNHHIIACSPAVAQNLTRNHQIKAENMTTVISFIQIDEDYRNSRDKIAAHRKSNNLKQHAFIVFGCGTICPRKGTDLFIETAISLKNKGFDNFHFYWIGENRWDIENSGKLLPDWEDHLKKISDKNVSGHITFLGEKYNALGYLKAGDLFFLPSREDPFPLVCLEAAQFGAPVICFKNAGGMPEFVSDDAGFALPMGDIDGAADAIGKLINNPDLCFSLGAKAREKVLQNYSLENGARKIMDVFSRLCNFKPTVSVIIPNCSHAGFLEKRIRSVFEQTFSDFEVIIINNRTDDNWLEVINKYKSLKNVAILSNIKNSGNVFSQWEFGVQEAKGELIWVVDTEDYCDAAFLEKMLPYFNDRDVSLAYCSSYQVNDQDEIIENCRNRLGSLDSAHWQNDYIATGAEEINFGLGVINSIGSSSSVIFRKSDLENDYFTLSKQFRFLGDWVFYLQLIKDHKIAFCSKKLDYHRMNPPIAALKADVMDSRQSHTDETLRIHQYVIDNFELQAEFLTRWENYYKTEIDEYFCNRNDYPDRRPFDELREQIRNKIKNRHYSALHIDRKLPS
jgi:glycosyltransferase involved in cell wall biosynthesis